MFLFGCFYQKRKLNKLKKRLTIAFQIVTFSAVGSSAINTNSFTNKTNALFLPQTLIKEKGSKINCRVCVDLEVVLVGRNDVREECADSIGREGPFAPTPFARQ